MARADGRAERAAANRARLLTAARALVAQGGFHHFRLEDVAAAAGVTRPTVYNQFGSREGLIEAVLEDIGDRAVFERIADCLDVPDADAAVRELIAQFCRAWSSDELMFRRMMGLAHVDPALGAMLQTRQGLLRSITDGMAARLAEGGLLRDGWTGERAGRALWMLCSFETWDQLREAGSSRAEIGETLVDLVSAFVRLAPRP